MVESREEEGDASRGEVWGKVRVSDSACALEKEGLEGEEGGEEDAGVGPFEEGVPGDTGGGLEEGESVSGRDARLAGQA